jgi:hypothetical protein
VLGDLRLHASTPLHISPQSGTAALTFEGRPVQRMKFRATHSHVNPFSAGTPAEWRGRTLPAGVTHWHPWTANRRWPRSPGDNGSTAMLVEHEFDGLDAALAWFALECNVRDPLPPAPWRPRFL